MKSARKLGGVGIYFFLFLALAAACLSEQNDFSYLVGSHLGNIPEKFESHWPKG